MNKNIYATTPRDKDPFFHPRKYTASKTQVVEALQQILKFLSGWQLEEYRENQGRIKAGRRGWIGLGEEVNFYVVQGTDGVTSLEIISHSRTGKGNWGQNKRNVKEVLNQLDLTSLPSQSR